MSHGIDEKRNFTPHPLKAARADAQMHMTKSHPILKTWSVLRPSLDLRRRILELIIGSLAREDLNDNHLY
jgi:hypothetical protein